MLKHIVHADHVGSKLTESAEGMWSNFGSDSPKSVSVCISNRCYSIECGMVEWNSGMSD